MSTQPSPIRWHITDRIVDRALDYVAQAAEQALRQRGAFHLVLAGGSTPRALYQQLTHLSTDWSRWHLWFGDERCLPAQDPERNSRMAGNVWLDASPIPITQIHVIHAEYGPQSAAADYCRQLEQVELFDLVLLGLGEDGHTASLFPRLTLADEPADVIAVYHAPKPPSERVSLSVRRLSASRKILFMVTGASKQAAVNAWRRGEPLPATLINSLDGVDILLSQDACASNHDFPFTQNSGHPR